MEIIECVPVWKTLVVALILVFWGFMLGWRIRSGESLGMNPAPPYTRARAREA